MKRFGFLVYALLYVMQLNGQNDSISTAVKVEQIEITALRIKAIPNNQPYSIALYQSSPIQDTRQQLSLQEYLYQMPGVFSLNANNYAQDLRISIRGFGARSAFGIRGIKIIVDGIPETTPDGQGQIDNLNIGLIEQIEVLKGPSSALYGNASGGVIQISTQDKVNDNFLKAGLTFGSYGMQQYQFGGGIGTQKTHAIVQGTYTKTNGYREQNNLQNLNLNTRINHLLSDKSAIKFQMNYTNSPTGDDPGSLSSDAVEENRRQARDRNVLFKTGEAVEQFKIGANYTLDIDERKEFSLYGFYNKRDFEGKIPIPSNGWIDLNRDYFGQGGCFKLENPSKKNENTFQIGYDWALQLDDRQRFQNNEGVKGSLSLDQLEKFSAIGFYALDHLEIGKWLFTAGLRFDINNLSADDHKLDDGDQSGNEQLTSWNPSIGFNVEAMDDFHIYGSFRSSFETPALSELSANPTGDGGFNGNLESQRAYNYDIGLKGNLGAHLDYDMTYFHIDTENDLVPYELEQFPDRTFYRNAGSTTRDGIESWIRYHMNKNISLSGSYTYSNFRYDEYQINDDDFDGNELPGIPKHLLSLLLAVANQKGLSLRLQHRYTSQFFASDSNTDTAIENSYHVTDLSMSYRIESKRHAIVPFLGFNNLFATEYSDNIRINAFGGRYYEPAAKFNLYGGVRLKLTK